MPVSAAAGTVIGSGYAQTSFHGRAVADVAALTAIVASNRFDRQERTVESPLNQYVFDEQSAAADNPPDILEPDDSPATGRWIRLVPGGGVPLAHAASHSDGGSDEITVENLATSEPSTTKALMSDGAGALVFGALVAAAHAIGGAVHTADTLSNLNSKISDATLVDSGSIVLRDGTQTLTAPWNVGRFDVTLSFVAGADPINNTTGLDSRKLGFESRLWDGAAPQTRTGFIRFEDISGTNDQGRFTFSSDDNGGSENDFLNIYRDSSGDVVLQPGSATAMIFQRNNGLELFKIADNGTIIFSAFTHRMTTGTFRIDDNLTFMLGTDGDDQFVHSNVQTNDGLLLGLAGSEGNYFLITDKARIGSDRALPAFSNPTLVIEDGGVSSGKWGSIAHDGTNFLITANAGAVLLNGVAPILADASVQLTANWDVGPFDTLQQAIRARAGLNLLIKDNAGSIRVTVYPTAIVINESGDDYDSRFEGATDPLLLTVNAGLDRVGVGINLSTGKLHVDQNDVAGAIPVLVLDQGDIDDTFINFIGTSAADGTRSISSDTTEDAAKVGAFRVELNGVVGWMRVFANES